VKRDQLAKQIGLAVVLGVAFPAVLVLFTLWHGATKRGGQTFAEPFRIAGNFYYVGAPPSALGRSR
jgi:hypothetical protein